MEGLGLALIAIAILLALSYFLRRQRKRAAEFDVEDRSWLRAPVPEPLDPVRTHAPVSDFHVHGDEARVFFDVPLGDEDDEVLHSLLVDEAMEVVREKRHTLPIDDVTQIVVFAGRGDEPREVGRTLLPAAGELPPPMETEMLTFTHIAKDPFAGTFEVDHSVHYDTKTVVPEDELRPWREDLRIPSGLLRGMRARGIDPDGLSGPDFILEMLGMFSYTVRHLDEPNTHMATKDGNQIYIRNEIHGSGQHPELDESVITRFVVEFGSSGAQFGLLISDKYAPYLIHDIERREPRIRFITRERGQGFIDSMALG